MYKQITDPLVLILCFVNVFSFEGMVFMQIRIQDPKNVHVDLEPDPDP